ncbi:MAG: hypothetical protein U9Q19_00805, partial [Pseudomonadota bacterium]|nr:hypothetical protein [Pseudomonadota bacterium]
MNIEQKNTLFIISLVLLVLFGIAGSGFMLIRDHVTVGIGEDLDRAQKVFVQAQKNRFDNLLTVARSVSDEPGFIAATLNADIATVRSILNDLYPRSGADFMVVYLDTGPGGVAATGNKPHYTSPQTLSSEVLTELAGNLTRGDLRAFGNARLYDS